LGDKRASDINHDGELVAPD
jgi:hypothetical protein